MNRELKLDPRTVLLLLVIANVVAFTQQSVAVEISWVAVLLVVLVLCGCRAAALKLAVVFGCCLLLQYQILPNGPENLASSFSVIISYGRKMFPCLIVGSILVKKTSVRELTLALRTWRVPQGLIIPISVTIRYFPAIREEFGHIRDAIRLRNIRGLQKLECIIVPLMISATTTAEELSAAAVTRGIENPKPKTSIAVMRMRTPDFACLTASLLFACAAIVVR